MEHFLTLKRKKELQSELEKLKTVKRLEVAKRLKSAKELGDLSENSEYLEAREEQGRVERRIFELENILKNPTIISEKKRCGSKVEIGSTVEVLRDRKSLKFIIVGSSEAKPEEGFISNNSPLGKELIGKEVGDKIVIKVPDGNIEYKIKKII